MDTIISSALQKFLKILDIVRTDLASIRTGKASAQLIENLFIEAYGTKMKLMELATISTSDTTTLVVTPFDLANQNSIAKGIQEANLGLTPIPEDSFIRVIVPSLSSERRQEYIRLAKTKVEGSKVMLRQARHEIMEEIERLETDEDTKKRLKEEVQKHIDEFVEKLDAVLMEKEKELTII